jgi:tetratricopeptide (TPR) repeat protein
MPSIESAPAPLPASLRLRGAPARHSPVPAPPRPCRRELDLLEQVPGALGFLLWRVVSDVLLWTGAPPAARAGLITGATPAELVEPALAEAPAAADDLRLLLEVGGGTEPGAVAAACARVAEWAEAEEMKGVALHFAELAAWADPDSAALAAGAGRICRRDGQSERAKVWLQRSLRLARRAGNEADFADAQRLYGFVLIEQGRFSEAEHHLWKSIRAALRTGRTSLAGAGYHNLLVVTVHQERWDEAWTFARKAVQLYKVGYPSLPELAHDVGYFWCRCGYYSSAIPLFEACLPLIQRRHDRILAHASLARSGAVVRDNIRFQRSASAAIELAERDHEHAAAALYHVAEGARCFQEWERSGQLAREARQRAHERRNATVIARADALLEAVEKRIPGETDSVPPEGGVVDECRALLLRKLRRHRDAAKGPRSPLRVDD